MPRDLYDGPGFLEFHVDYSIINVVNNIIILGDKENNMQEQVVYGAQTFSGFNKKFSELCSGNIR